MNLKQLFLTKNECYLSGKRHAVRGILLHSTGANNPNLKRYVGPDDGLLGHNAGGNHWNQARVEGGQQMCAHAFIGKLADGSIATYQTLPWDMVGWHSGSGSLGSAKNANNTGYIGIEICEDGLTDAAYFGKVYTEAVEVCVQLCKTYGLDPAAAILCHCEGSARGIASSHADVMHWFPKHGKNMDTFRADVAELLAAAAQHPDTAGLTPICGKAELNAAQMRALLLQRNPDAPDYAAIYLEEGAAEGIRGNIAFAQSCLETSYWRFGGDVKAEQNNFCGLGATGGGESGYSFATPREGIRAQIQHLKAYANTDDLVGTCIDPRFRFVKRGVAAYVEWLGIKENPTGAGWATGQGYGSKILDILETMRGTAVQDDSGELKALRAENARLKAEIVEMQRAIGELAARYA